MTPPDRPPVAPRKPLTTDVQARNARPDPSRAYTLSAGSSLFLEVRPTGTKAWLYRFKLRQGDRWAESIFTIGEYRQAPVGESPAAAQARRAAGYFTLSEARLERDRARDLVRQGISPVYHRKLDRMRAQQQHASTFELAAADWITLRDWEQVTKDKRLATLRRLVFPRIGALPLRQVTPAHVLDVLTTVDRDNGPTVRAETQRTLAAIFDHAIATLRADLNPVTPVRRALPAVKTRHKRPLDAGALGELLRDVAAHAGRVETAAAFRLMWWTLCRPREAVEAEWSELDLDRARWRIDAQRTKARREHVVPLPRQAVAALRALHGVNGHRRHVFPGRDDRERPMTVEALRQMLSVLGWAGRFSPHAARVTGSTRLNEMGYAPDWIERQLAHADPSRVRGTYNHADYFDDRTRMMQAWADWLDRLEAGAQVIPLTQPRRRGGRGAAG